MCSGGSILEQGVQLHPSFWLCVPVCHDATKIVTINNYFVVSIEMLQNRKFTNIVTDDAW